MTAHERSLLHDILRAGNEIVEYTSAATRDSYLSDRRLQLVVERLFMIIGEAAARIHRQYPALGAQIPELREPIGFRNFLVHVYDQIRPSRVWDIAQSDLGLLLSRVAAVLASAPEQE